MIPEIIMFLTAAASLTGVWLRRKEDRRSLRELLWPLPYQEWTARYEDEAEEYVAPGFLLNYLDGLLENFGTLQGPPPPPPDGFELGIPETCIAYYPNEEARQKSFRERRRRYGEKLDRQFEISTLDFDEGETLHVDLRECVYPRDVGQSLVDWTCGQLTMAGRRRRRSKISAELENATEADRILDRYGILGRLRRGGSGDTPDPFGSLPYFEQPPDPGRQIR